MTSPYSAGILRFVSPWEGVVKRKEKRVKSRNRGFLAGHTNIIMRLNSSEIKGERNDNWIKENQ
jgi:hypothetical protein